jgi:hypothetical protein
MEMNNSARRALLESSDIIIDRRIIFLFPISNIFCTHEAFILCSEQPIYLESQAVGKYMVF